MRFSLVASCSATVKRSGLDLVSATASMAVSASCNAVASRSGLDLVRAILSSCGSASVRAVASVSGLLPVRAVPSKLLLTPPVRAVANSLMSASW